MFEVINTVTDESHGTYPSLDEARGCAIYDHLRRYQIWNGDILVFSTENEEEGERYGTLA